MGLIWTYCVRTRYEIPSDSNTQSANLFYGVAHTPRHSAVTPGTSSSSSALSFSNGVPVLGPCPRFLSPDLLIYSSYPSCAPQTCPALQSLHVHLLNICSSWAVYFHDQLSDHLLTPPGKAASCKSPCLHPSPVPASCTAHALCQGRVPTLALSGLPVVLIMVMEEAVEQPQLEISPCVVRHHRAIFHSGNGVSLPQTCNKFLTAVGCHAILSSC